MIFQQTNPASLGGARQALIQKLAAQFAQQQKGKGSTPQPAAYDAPNYGNAGGGGGSVGLPVGLGAARNAGLTQQFTGGDNVASAIAARLGAINPRALSGEFSGSPGQGVGNVLINGGRNLGSSMLFAPGMDTNSPTPGGAPQGQGAGMTQVANPIGPGTVAGNAATGHPYQMDPPTAGGTAPGGSGLIPIGGGAFFDPATGKVVGLGGGGPIGGGGAGGVVFGRGAVTQG